jgi:hypothetical protein
MLSNSDLFSARPCDKHGNFLNGEPPPQYQPRNPNDWTPFTSRLQFETAEFLFQRVKMSAGNIDMLMELWAAGMATHGDEPPFADHCDLYETIDVIQVGGDVPWQQFEISYNGERPATDVPSWMEHSYEVYFRDPRQLLLEVLANPSFANDFDYTPMQQFTPDGTRRYENFMSGDWAWKQAVWLSRFGLSPSPLILASNQDIISAEIPDADGAMFVPVLVGSDVTTASVATGQNDYWPLYASVGNIHNNICRGHGNGLILIGFLAIPKSKQTYKHVLRLH